MEVSREVWGVLSIRGWQRGGEKRIFNKKGGGCKWKNIGGEDPENVGVSKRIIVLGLDKRGSVSKGGDQG